MNDQEFISELSMIKAHVNEVTAVIDNLLKRFDAPKKKKSGLSDSSKAKLLAGRERTRNRN